MRHTLSNLIITMGLGQLALAAASLAIPRVLRWREETAKLRPLTRQVFWTYAGYIWCTNICFGVLSLVGSAWLTDGSPLAACVCRFVTAYWLARIVIQFTYFDRSDTPPGLGPRVAEVALVILFVALVIVYGWATWFNLQSPAVPVGPGGPA